MWGCQKAPLMTQKGILVYADFWCLVRGFFGMVWGLFKIEKCKN